MTPTDRRTDLRVVALAAALDLALVAVFVAVGRGTHASATGFLTTYWPFGVGLALGWLLLRAWRAPSSWRTALPVAVVAVAAGMLLRALSGQGVQTAFVVVATVSLLVLLVGWRLLAALVRRATVRIR